MKRLLPFKLNIHLSTSIFVLLSIIYNSFVSLMIFYFLAFVHELSHYFVAYLFGVKSSQIDFHPLGFFIEMEDISFLKPYKQILILLAGPLSFFISLFTLYIFNHYFSFISLYQYNLALNNNLSLLIFNLLPFYPLDGGRILEVILLKHIPSYKAKIILQIISSIFSLFIIYLCIKDKQILLLFFILFSLISSIVSFKRNYLNYLFSRIGNISLFSKKISRNNNIYHFNHNYFINRGNIQDEEEYILSLKIKDLKISEKKEEKLKKYLQSKK